MYCIVLKNLYICPVNRYKNMDTSNVKSQMKKGMLEYCILLIVSHKRVYVSEILSELKAASMIVVEGTIYPLMTRLKNGGLLAYSWEESQQGPPRKYYEITDAGKEFLEELENSWNQLTEIVNHLKNQ